MCKCPAISAHTPWDILRNIKQDRVLGWAAFDGGNDHSAALQSDGTLWAWGNNYSGQLGDGTTGNKYTPVQIGTATDWLTVSTGGAHTIAMKSDGTLWTWGSNAGGQLGNGTTTNQNAPVNSMGLAVSDSVSPTVMVSMPSATITHNTPVSYTVTYTDTSFANSTLTPAMITLNTSGTARGQVMVTGTGATRTVSIYNIAGNGTLGISLSAGSAVDQAGNPAPAAGPSATFTVDDSLPLQPQLSAGGSHTAVIKSNGTLWTWGGNGNGQLGDGTTTTRVSPVLVASPTPWALVSAGDAHTLAIKADGTLWAWGKNTSGQVGNGTTTDRLTPAQIGTGTTWIAVAAGASHSVALKSDGTLWGWGNGSLVNGVSGSKSFPVQIGTATNWIAVAVGYYHSMALKSDGTLWGWGYNSSGQLGDGTTTDRSAPYPVSGGDTTWVAVAAGGSGINSHTLARKSDGTLWAWGYNYSGQLGTGSPYNSSVPVKINSTLVLRPA